MWVLDRLPLEKGDTIIRPVGEGREEVYSVTVKGHQAASERGQYHYRAKVIRETTDQEADEMLRPIRDLNETVTILKADGTRIEGVSARYHQETSKVVIGDGSLRLEDGDTIERSLPNGLKDRFIVEDRGFHAPTNTHEAHFQAKVRKEGAPSAAGTTHNYHLYGPNSRVNMGSVDKSVNTYIGGSQTVFHDLRQLALSHLQDEPRRAEVLAAVDGMEQSQGSPGFTQKYCEFMGVVADHMGVFGPLLPMLSQLLPR